MLNELRMEAERVKGVGRRCSWVGGQNVRRTKQLATRRWSAAYKVQERNDDKDVGMASAAGGNGTVRWYGGLLPGLEMDSRGIGSHPPPIYLSHNYYITRLQINIDIQ